MKKVVGQQVVRQVTQKSGSLSFPPRSLSCCRLTTGRQSSLIRLNLTQPPLRSPFKNNQVQGSVRRKLARVAPVGTERQSRPTPILLLLQLWWVATKHRSMKHRTHHERRPDKSQPPGATHHPAAAQNEEAGPNHLRTGSRLMRCQINMKKAHQMRCVWLSNPNRCIANV